MARSRTASLEAKFTARCDTVRKATAFLEDAKKARRTAALEASHGGVSTQRLADLQKTSWGRIDEQIKRAALEARPLKA